MSRETAAGRAALAGTLLALAATLAACVSVSRISDGPPASTEPGLTEPRTTEPTSTHPTPPMAPAGSPGTFLRPTAPPSADVSPAPSAPSGQVRLGFIALDDRNRFGQAVSAGIRASAASAGVELIECDPRWTRDLVSACAEQVGDGGIDGLISFQPFVDLAGDVCAATGDVPTVGIVFGQGPCQVTRLAIDQAESGRLAGAAVGRFVADRWDCRAHAYLSLESSDADPDGRARMAGYRAGYEESCPLPERTIVLDGADRLVTAQTQVAGQLDRIEGRRIIVVGLNEDAILGAMAAASAAGREGQLWYSGQLADPGIRQHIACDEQYIASVAQFPERFGELIVPALLDAIDGGDVPAQLEAQLVLVTAENVRELFPDTPPCPS